MSIGGGVAACLFALFGDAGFGGRCDGGIDSLRGKFVKDGDRGGARGGDGVDGLVGHCRFNVVRPRGMVPAEVEIVNAAAGVTVKLKNGIWLSWTALRFCAQDSAKGSNVTRSSIDFLYAFSILLYFSCIQPSRISPGNANLAL